MKRVVTSGVQLACALAVATAVAVWPSIGSTGFGASAAEAQWADNPASVPRMSIDELRKRLAADDVLVLDVRDARSYELGHIPGAILLPFEEIEKRAGELREEKRPIVAYCT